MTNISREWLEKAISEGHLNIIDYSRLKYCEKIGEGGFGTVNKYKWNDCELIIALKCLKVDGGLDKDSIKEFIEELKLLRSVCSHPNIIKFYGVTRDNNGDYNMILQFAADGNLRQYLGNNFKKLQWKDKITIAQDIVFGLMFLHCNNIVHRDLHSKNILIHNGQIMIADFGLAKRISETSMTSNSKTRGMPAYLEPKCFLNPKYKRDKRSDIYSLGVILWEISSGRPPFQSIELSYSIPIQVYNGSREAPVQGTPILYVKLYERCWDSDPSTRPVIRSVFETLNKVQNDNSINNVISTENPTTNSQYYRETHSNSQNQQSYTEMYSNSLNSLDKMPPIDDLGSIGSNYKLSTTTVNVVVSIDFGTTHSGFAYAHVSNPSTIIANDYWQEFTGPLKTDTVLRYDQNFKNVEAWGLPALVQKPNIRKIFKGGFSPVQFFKLHLSKKFGKPDLPEGLYYKKTITDYLTEMGKLIKKVLLKRWPNINFLNQVLLVITVPAEYTEHTKDIMKESILRAGLISKNSDKLKFIEESKAAAIYCKGMLRKQQGPIIILDCGSYKVDFTIFELENNELKENINKTTEFAGSACVDKEFLKFLEQIVGVFAISSLAKEYNDQFQYMLSEFQRQVKLPFTGIKKDFKVIKFDIKEVCPMLKQFVTESSRLKLERNNWIIDLGFNDVKSMFDLVVDKIIKLIGLQLNLGITYTAMFLVGGFSESKYLQMRINHCYHSQIKNIIFLDDPIAAIERYFYIFCNCRKKAVIHTYNFIIRNLSNIQLYSSIITSYTIINSI
ncbi:kinase-like domain-containing protein [Gigaspora rosea]|uniref:Kinase-like domain-containing protein n=1 Tax=Gigaspora rosea TaxID=44941 RepID=A0A397UFN7_9GLOM|nr:kinase-like domain-containing protein [Gigaspora rosea]